MHDVVGGVGLVAVQDVGGCAGLGAVQELASNV